MGLGKTHLMHAIGNQVIAKFPRKRVVYATSEKFTNEFDAMRARMMSEDWDESLSQLLGRSASHS